MRIFGCVLIFSLVVMAYGNSTSTTAPPTAAPTVTQKVVPTVPPTVVPTANTSTTLAPVHKEAKNKWVVSDDGHNCILLVVQNITFTHLNKSSVIPRNANATGDCLQTLQHLRLTWNNNNFTMVFLHEDKKYSVSEIRIEMNKTIYQSRGKLFKAETNISIRCKQTKDITLTSKDGKDTIQMTIENFQLEGFRTAKHQQFSKEIDGCPAERSNITVYILVTVFLIAGMALGVAAFCCGWCK